MATAKRAFGTLLKRETTPSSGTYTTIGGMTRVSLPALLTDFAESTDMETASATRTHIPTLNSVGDCSFDLNFDMGDAAQAQLIADQVAQTVRLYKIVLTDNSAAEQPFNAYVKSFEITAERDGLVTAAVVLKVTGLATPAT